MDLPKKILEDIFKACKIVWEKNRTSIRPLIGLNCKAGSFDAMAGSLDQDKKNEELRAKILNILSEK
jgi:hypothetical protein